MLRAMGRGRARRVALIAILAGAVGLLAAIGSGAAAGNEPSAAAASQCVALKVGPNLRAQMKAAYRRVSNLPANVRVVIKERVKYGRCGHTHWAWGLPQPASGQVLSEAEQIAIQDHSPIFKRPRGRAWQELGIGPVCGPGALPRAMARAWRLSCQ